MSGPVILRRLLQLAALGCVLFGCLTARAEKSCALPWQGIPETGRQMLKPAPLTMVGLAAVTPIFFVPTNGDTDLRKFAQTDLGGSYNAEEVSLYTPYILMPTIGAFYIGSWLGDWCEGAKPSAAIVQAVAFTAVTYGIIKVTTGRRWPVWGDDPDEFYLDDPTRAQDWAPFTRIDEELGAFPSGHTAFMFAFASALRASSPELGWWRYAGYPFAIGMGFAMVYNDHHWVSDVISGALLGEAIGGATGRSFSPLPQSGQEVSWMFVPAQGGGVVSISGMW